MNLFINFNMIKLCKKVCLSRESQTVLIIIKLASSTFYMCLHLYLYCYLFDSMNIKVNKSLMLISHWAPTWFDKNKKIFFADAIR